MKNTQKALIKFLEAENKNIKSLRLADYAPFDYMDYYEVIEKDGNEYYCYVSCNNAKIKQAVKNSLKELYSCMGHNEFIKKVLPYTSYNYNDDYSINFKKLAQCVINEYGAGHELSSYDGKTHEIDYNDKTYYIFKN